MVRIATGNDAQFHYKANADGAELSWRHLTSVSSRELAPMFRTFDCAHEIWSCLEPGDRLEISLEASSWYFPNVRSEWGVSLQVFMLWEPSKAMLNLIYKGAAVECG
jgi:hypothetical protein